jgi:putative Ca2+/H+ antiporter (TMEM165/GDT1 family)
VNSGAFLASFFLIGLAELGDKTQLLTLVLSTKYPFLKVMAAISAATAILMAVAVLIGGVIFDIVPQLFIQIFAGVLFLFFGLWTLFGKEKSEDEKKINSKSIFVIVFSSFFLAELGDKTQLSTLALSAQYGSPVGVWFGATISMILVNLIAAIIGKFMKGRIPEDKIKYLGGIAFILFGLWSLFEVIR